MVIRPITYDALNQLAPLLQAAFGSDFDLADEPEYFPSLAPTDWVYLNDATGTPRGYLRHFPATSTLYVADVYVPRSAPSTYFQ